MQLKELINHFHQLYGRRNRIFLSGLRKRIEFLNLAIGDLQEAIRKEVNLEIPLARVVSRIFCVTENFISLPLIEMMARKYPETCAYCQLRPCQCPENRQPVKLRPFPKENQLAWTLTDWQIHLDQLYGNQNKSRGIDYILGRLYKEVSELLNLQMGVSHHSNDRELPQTLDDIENDFSLELADVLAWTIAVANFYGMDLERASLARYGQGCWLCHKSVCICTQFNYNPVKWGVIKTFP